MRKLGGARYALPAQRPDHA